MLKVIKFSAVWCGPCKRLAPVFEKVMAATKDVDFEEVDVDNEPLLASQFKIMSIPTIVFMKDGSEVHRLVGFVKEQDIVNKIAELK